MFLGVFLQAEKGTLAHVRDRETEVFVGELILSQQANYNEYWKTWVFKDYNHNDKCMTIINYKVYEDNCNLLLPVVCETGKTPKLQSVT